MKCPLDRKRATSYSFNPAILNIAPQKISNPGLTVLAYEGHEGKFDFRHGGKAAVGFCDDRVKSVDTIQAKTLRWKP